MGKDRQTSARREWMRQKARERENQDGEGRNEQSSLVSGDKSINFCTKHGNPYKADIQITLTNSQRFVTSRSDFDKTLRMPTPDDGFVDSLCRLTSVSSIDSIYEISDYSRYAKMSTAAESTHQTFSDAPKSKKTAKKKRNTSKYVNKNKKSFKSFGNGPDTRNSHLLQESSNSERNESTFVPETSVWSDNYNRSFGNSHSNDTDCTFVPQTLDTTWASVYSQQSENTFVPQTLDDTWKTNNESVAYVPQLINENHNT
ncbi:Oidioi.mRNA.OKI2018_I69.XSR.g15250.t1.cds [Oikopleura dioica]|uniref:Oidioi.mRNA.OKI2018_I69.XSR.g15250.t1.cds n=1 Tax=Oikopleura dioica TaxID=34765 RepID=A0ABN7SHE6_OIKDI|nr:Oidioi.mRNA.OKI2018_I69.XSR.g15250.t1.cds [Oikopleura dioica]